LNIKLTLFFDGAFWAALFERINLDYYEVSKVVFHTEPSNQEILDYVLHHYNSLHFSPAISNADDIHILKISPKRLQRLIRKETTPAGIGTKAQQALKLDQEAGKLQRKSLSKLKKDAVAKAKFQLRQKKKKEKQKGH
jgi:hypothetical protein